MPKLFISYRRADSQDVSDRIYDQMVDHFGENNVFQDVTDIPFGVDFREYLQEQIAKCDAVLVVIGPDWTRIMLERADQPNDFVRIEVENALKLEKLVIPVTVRGGTMPGESDIPKEIGQLSWLNAARIRPNPDFKQDCAKIAKSIKSELQKRHALNGSANALKQLDDDGLELVNSRFRRNANNAILREPISSIGFFETTYTNSFGDTIYRHHPITWVKGILRPSVLLLLSGYVLLFAQNIEALQGIEASVRVVALILVILSLIFMLMSDIKWRREILIVGEETITTIDNHYWRMQVSTNQISLQYIDNILSEQTGLLSKMLNFGKIHIGVRGHDNVLTIIDLKDPRSIQSEIAKYIAARRRKLVQNVDLDQQ